VRAGPAEMDASACRGGKEQERDVIAATRKRATNARQPDAAAMACGREREAQREAQRRGERERVWRPAGRIQRIDLRAPLPPTALPGAKLRRFDSGKVGGNVGLDGGSGREEGRGGAGKVPGQALRRVIEHEDLLAQVCFGFRV